MPKNLFGQSVNTRGEILGCSACPLDKAPGIVKIKGLERVKQQWAFIWAMCPGEQENKQKLELVGPAGELLWNTLGKQGLTRKDFAVQNVVRCRPTEDGQNRDPSKRELECCSVYNDEALRKNRGEALVHVVLGDVAATQLLGKGYRKDQPVFWHEPWNAYVVLNWHPSYILRKGGESAGFEYFTWRDRFRAVKAAISYPGRWGFAKAQKHTVVRTNAEFNGMEKALRESGQNASFDIEDGYVDGKHVILLAGFGVGRFLIPEDMNSWKGESWSVVLDYPDANRDLTRSSSLKLRVKKLLEDPEIKLTMHNGSYDVKQSLELLGAYVHGYEFDTMYGAYLRFSFLNSCSLENLTYRLFPEFGDYKETTEGYTNFADVPLDRLLLRNLCDCDVTKRLEELVSPKISHALIKVYIHAGITLDAMEERGPLLDWEQHEKAQSVVPEMIADLDRRLQRVCGDYEFNCSSDKQVAWFVYDFLKCEPIEGSGRSTNKKVLELLAVEAEDPEIGRALGLISTTRAVKKIQSTYLDGYARSAKQHSGELRTHWKLTGTVTGRLSSGKGDNDVTTGLVNFQNLHNLPLLQNLLVSDLRWREAL
jgi:uracil-DNA glycosylase family 4